MTVLFSLVTVHCTLQEQLGNHLSAAFSTTVYCSGKNASCYATAC